MTMDSRRIPILIYDGDCGFCTSIARWALRRLPASAAVVPWQLVPDLGAYGLRADDAARHAYWIDRNGDAHRGHLAIAEALRAMGPGWRALGAAARVPPISWVAEPVYGVVTRFRHHLPGGTPACHLPD